MFDVGWTEMLVIGALALIVVGPRDLPQLLRTIGQTVGKIKRMAREFQRSMEDAARETDLASFKELRDLKKDMGDLDFRKQASKAQSYLNQPVKTEAGKAGATGAAAAAATTAGTKAPDQQAAPARPDEPRPASAPEAGVPAAEPEQRQAGAKG